jgi:hypothetical protein
MAKSDFNRASACAFIFTFSAGFPGEDLHGFLHSLGMTPTRTDDWDREAGFRLVGETGALRLFLPDEARPCFTLMGTATDDDSWVQVRDMAARCKKAITAFGGKTDPARSWVAPKPPRR